MLSRYATWAIQNLFIFIAIFYTTQVTMAESGSLGASTQHQPIVHSAQPPIPTPGVKPNPGLPTRAMHRTGTAIIGARNSVSIKSTDAGIIHYPSAAPATHAPNVSGSPYASNCINCGIIDFINNINQNNVLNAMASGIVAGTIARKIGEHGAHPHPQNNAGRGHSRHSGQQHYHVGIIMHDGSQQVITVPDASQLHRGDRIQLIDGMIVPEHTVGR
ncbi:hypothetical protein [Nitrosomonas aestuarii]|uniref:hypothetical protein n=1 Tax=Nitrosomonas aestuarii TaxID=52441 RepID=UPI000D2FE6AE|nr:hypothetical protein [Nitrosomonas aestuarii]PTN12598.1 hypothetical protein C8R11_103166 [Nitrosomonas aestuarii]